MMPISCYSDRNESIDFWNIHHCPTGRYSLGKVAYMTFIASSTEVFSERELATDVVVGMMTFTIV
jgi:hypothetical protein